VNDPSLISHEYRQVAELSSLLDNLLLELSDAGANHAVVGPADAADIERHDAARHLLANVLTTVAQSLEATTTAAAPSPALPYGFVLELRDQLGPGFDDYLASLWTSAERLRSDDVDDQVLATAEVVAEAADVDASHAFGQMSR
jgi:hypothetical protein